MENNFKQAVLNTINSQSIDKLLKWALDGDITYEEMREAGLSRQNQELFIEQKDKEKLARQKEKEKEDAEKTAILHKEQILNNLRNNRQSYSVKDIRNKMEEGILNPSDVSDILGPENLTKITSRKRSIEDDAGFDDWSKLPPLLDGRTDMFILGTVGSGKSCMLAGLLAYAEQEGHLATENNAHSAATLYKNSLINYVEAGDVPLATPGNVINHIAVGFRNGRYIHPFSIVEMGGGKFNDTYKGGTLNDDHTIGARDYLASKNKKVIFLVIAYDIAINQIGTMKVKQSHQLAAVLGIMAKEKEKNILANTDAVILVITKADLMPKELIGDGDLEGLKRGCRQYAEENLKALLADIRDLSNKYNFERLILPFSLGNFVLSDLYDYKNETSKEIYNKLISYCHAGEKKPYWKKIFKY